MKGTFAIFRRELAGLFVGPLAWILLCLALVLNGSLFVLYLKSSGGSVDLALRFALGESWMPWALLVLGPPLLTMRMISEEARSGVLEFIMTAPVSDAAVVAGKFAAATTFFAILWSSAFVYALVLGAVGPVPDLGMVLVGFAGLVLASGLFCAIGLFASSLTDTPIVAAFGAIVFNLAFVLAPLLAELSNSKSLAGLVAHIDVIDHHKSSFLLGVFDTAYLVFFVSGTALFLFLSARALEARRWR